MGVKGEKNKDKNGNKSGKADTNGNKRGKEFR